MRGRGGNYEQPGDQGFGPGEPVKPLGERGPVFHALKPGDRVRVPISGRTGVIVKRCAPRRDGWIVRWDEPVFGVTEGRVAWANLEPEEKS